MSEVTATMRPPANSNYDPVHRPAHYDLGNGLDVIDVIEDVFGIDGHLPQALTYLMRAGKKGDALEDYAKALWYVRRARKMVRHWEPRGAHMLSVHVEAVLVGIEDDCGKAIEAIVTAAMANKVGIYLRRLQDAENILAALVGKDG
jgi:hypothetical protein